MIRLKTEQEIVLLREGGRRLALVLAKVGTVLKPGMSTAELSELVGKLIRETGDRPAFLGYRPTGARRPFPAAACVSLNDEVVHGIPSPDRLIKAGDLVGVDVGLVHKGLFTDMAITFPVGQISKDAERLLQKTREALEAGIAALRPGGNLGEVSGAIEAIGKEAGFGIVRELGGHGVGHKIHEPPEIPNYRRLGSDLKLQAGMVLAIEPMFCSGNGKVEFLPDGYTVKTDDGSLSAHFEHTVLVTDSGSEVLTLFDGKNLTG